MKLESLSFTLYNRNYTLINCYFPSGKTSTQTSQRIKIIQKLTSYVQNLNYKNRKLIIAGDFNLVLNQIDRTGHFTPNTNDKILFQKLLSNFDLIDSYRFLYPNTKTYFFSRSKPTSRLDRIYISSSLTIKITQTSYYNITFSNHNKAPIIALKLPSKTTFKSFHWKLNDSILSIPIIYQHIQSYIKTFHNPPSSIQQPLQWWDLLKTKIKNRIIYYSKIQQNNTKNFQNTLNNKLHHAQQLQQHEHIAHITHQLQQIRLNKQTGLQIRSRIPPLTSIEQPLTPSPYHRKSNPNQIPYTT